MLSVDMDKGKNNVKVNEKWKEVVPICMGFHIPKLWLLKCLGLLFYFDKMQNVM